MKAFALKLITAASVILAALPAMAEISGGEFSLSPFVGGFVYDSTQHQSPSIAMGMRLGYAITPNWGVETGVTYARPSANGRNGNLVNVRGDILYHFFPNKKLVPFLAVGGGWMDADYLAQVDSNATMDVGAGLKYYLNDSVALRTDFRQVMLLGPKTADGSSCSQNSEITIGLTFQFGGSKPASPALENTALASPPPAPPLPAPVAPAPVTETPSCWMADGTVAAQGKIQITGICIQDNALEILASEPIRKYDVFTLTEPSRLVVDISNATSGFKQRIMPIGSLGIATVRFEPYPEFLRLFLNAGQGRILPYRIEETDRSLRIIMTPSNVPPTEKEVTDKK